MNFEEVLDNAEAQLDNNNKQENNNTESKESKNMTQAEITNGKIVTTLKGGKGYEAPWVVIHSDSVEDAMEIMENPNFKDYVEKVQKVGSAFAGASNSGAGSVTQGQQQPGQPAASSQTPTPPPGYVYKTGMGKNGRPWYAFMGENRSDNLQPIWLNADGSRRG